jgi:hypothetical protein
MSTKTARIADHALRALLLLAPIAACGSDGDRQVKGQRAPVAQVKPPPRPRPNPTAWKDASPAAVLERMRAPLRLTPDPRFLSALERVDRLAGTEQPVAPVVRFGVGSWQVQIGANVIGGLPELPGFADQYAMVLGRAAQLWKLKNAAPLPDAGAEPLAPVPLDHAAGLLHEIEQRWNKGERSPDDARRAALAYAHLCLDLVDELDVADALHAQALAAAATAEAASGQPMAREKALLAALMGYAQSALAIAEALPADDAVRQFVHGDMQALTARAGEPAADAFTRLLALRALLSAGKTDEAEALATRFADTIAGSTPALAARAASGANADGHLRRAYSALIALREALGQSSPLAPALRHGAGGLRADASLAEVATGLSVPPAQLAIDADRRLAELAAKPDGAWLPADARAAYHEAHFAGAQGGLVRFQVDHPDLAAQAREVTAALASGKAPLAQQLDRYARDLVRAEQHGLPAPELVKDIRELRQLGPSALARLLRPLGERGVFGSAERQAALAIAERCDSRVECRALLSKLAHQNLHDPVADETVRVALIAEAPRLDPELRLRHLRMERDREGFLAALGETGTPAALRARQLAAGPPWLPPEETRRAFEALTKEAKSSFAVREAHASWLCEQKDCARAVAVLDDWLKQKHDDAAALTAARMLRARALHEAGKLQEAWVQLQPLLSSTGGVDGAVLARAALVRSAAGKDDEAIALARQRLERDPGASSLALLAQVLWQAEKSDEAAALLEAHAGRLAVADFAGPLARAFADAHRDEPALRGVAACRALLGKKLDAQAVRALIGDGALPPELAFRCHEQLKATDELRHRDAAKGYVLLRAWKGEGEARTWIEQALPADQRDALAPHLHALGLHALLWELVADPKPDHPQAALIWLLRSAAFARAESPRPDWKQRLDQYHATHREALRDRLGLHLLGQLDQQGVWQALASEGERAECAYVFGLKAELDGDVAQAVDWYREALRGPGKSGELQWAGDALSAVRDAHKSLALLSAEARARKADREAPAPDAGTAPEPGGADGRILEPVK